MNITENHAGIGFEVLLDSETVVYDIINAKLDPKLYDYFMTDQSDNMFVVILAPTINWASIEDEESKLKAHLTEIGVETVGDFGLHSGTFEC